VTEQMLTRYAALTWALSPSSMPGCVTPTLAHPDVRPVEIAQRQRYRTVGSAYLGRRSAATQHVADRRAIGRSLDCSSNGTARDLLRGQIETKKLIVCPGGAGRATYAAGEAW
jgi:hypothetical protein